MGNRFRGIREIGLGRGALFSLYANQQCPFQERIEVCLALESSVALLEESDTVFF